MIPYTRTPPTRWHWKIRFPKLTFPVMNVKKFNELLLVLVLGSVKGLGSHGLVQWLRTCSNSLDLNHQILICINMKGMPFSCTKRGLCTRILMNSSVVLDVRARTGRYINTYNQSCVSKLHWAVMQLLSVCLH